MSLLKLDNIPSSSSSSPTKTQKGQELDKVYLIFSGEPDY